MPLRDQCAVGQRVSPHNAAQRVQKDVLVVGAERNAAHWRREGGADRGRSA